MEICVDVIVVGEFCGVTACTLLLPSPPSSHLSGIPIELVIFLPFSQGMDLLV